MPDSARTAATVLADLAATAAGAGTAGAGVLDREVEAVLLERLSEGHLALRAPWRLDDALDTLRLLVRGLAVAPGDGPADALRAFLEAATSPAAPPPARLLPAAKAVAREHTSLAARLADDDPLSPPGLRARIDLLAIAPMSPLAFWTARRHVRPLLDHPRLRATPQGRRLWLAGAQTFAACDGDRALADAAVELMRREHDVADHSDPLGPSRGITLLLRLEHFEEADTLLWRSQQAATAHPATAALHAAQQTLLLWMTGELESAVAVGRRAAAGPGAGGVFGGAVAARALVELDRPEDARALLATLPAPADPMDFAGAMQHLALAEVALREERPEDAVAPLEANLVGARLIGHRNPSGWRWLEPTTRALLATGEHDRVRSILRRASEDAERWGTPLVLAEVGEARAIAGLDHVPQPAAEAWPAHTVASTAAAAGLSPRVAEVIGLVAEGLRDREIAERLMLSPRTIHRHVSTALHALGLRNRTELAAFLRHRPAPAGAGAGGSQAATRQPSPVGTSTHAVS